MVGDQRRVATVLFADLVGFTALSERLDPEHVKALVDRCFERLAADIDTFGGRVDKVMGDAIVALFGAPIAHEDDAERAVRAGLRMQQTIALVSGEVDHAVQMRVGINTGEVLVGAVRAGREYTAMGDVVNTASRLQTAAEPGTVLVGPATYAATRNVVSYEAIDPVIAKGKELPVAAWVALEAIVPPGHRPRRTGAPLVGRETELALLTSVTSTAIERCRAALLVVHGEAGMGKSRLAEETGKVAACDHDAFLLEGRCVPYGEANVWWPVADAIRSAASISADASPNEIDTALRRIATAALQESHRLDELDRVVAGLHHLLGHDGALRGIDATRARDEAIRSVVAIAEGYTHRHPVMVVFSDLHWADQEVLDLIDTLLMRLARRPFVLMATARRSLRERWNPAPEAANAVVLHLDPLDTDAGQRLLFSLTGGELHPALASMLVDRAGGNPFYLEELVALITEAGVRTVDQLLATESGELPSTLRGLVAARLDALSAADRHLLDDASVLGRRNKIAAIVTMAAVKRDLDAEAARAHVESLAAREFLVLEGDTYSFRSDVIREVAYSTLTKADRARSHAGIAIWMERNEDTEHEHVVDQIASHYAAAAESITDLGNVAGVPDDVVERALTWLRRAAERAMSDSLPAVVVSLSTRALDILADSDSRRHEWLQMRAKARSDQYDLDDAEDDALTAVSLASSLGDDCGMARAQLVLGEIEQHRGDYPGALDLLHEAKRRFEHEGDLAGVADALRQIGMIHVFSGSFEAADAALEEALGRYETLGDRRGAAWTHQHLSWSAYTSGRVDEAEARVLEAMATFTELGDPGGLTWSRGLLAWVRFHQGADEEAQRLAGEVGTDAHERGEIWGEAMMVVLTGAIELWSGRVDDAVVTLRRASELFERIDDRFGALQARCGLARALVMSGDLDAGLQELAETRREIDQPGTGPDRVWFARIATLTVSVQLGDLELGRTVVDDVEHSGDLTVLGGADRMVALGLHHLQVGDVEAATRIMESIDETRGYVDAGRALVAAAAGRAAEAMAYADEIETHPNTYLDRAYGDIARALAHARLDRADQARAVLAQATSALDGTGDRLAQAVVRLADATVAEWANRPDAGAVRAVAEQRLDALGVRAEGWRSVLADALGAVNA